MAGFGVVFRVGSVFHAEGIAWCPSLGCEDFVAEAVGGAGPIRVVWVLGNFVAAVE